MNTEELDLLFRKEYATKQSCYVKWHESVVYDEDYSLNIDLGSCASVVLCGYDENNRIWMGANHLFKPRTETEDMALAQVADIYNKLTDLKCKEIVCLGVFGAGYRENSPAQRIARNNVMNIIEALSFYNLEIELFQTGFSQGLKIIKSDERQSLLIKHTNIGNKDVKIIEMSLSSIFKNYK